MPHRASSAIPSRANCPSCAIEKKPWMNELGVGAPGGIVLKPHMAAASVTAASTPAARGPLFHARKQGAARKRTP
eukprot:COSAG06_NODE_64130_length_260_cov_0.826087_1_plen_74_part_01